MSRQVQIRYVFAGNSESPVVELADDESVVGADHEGNQWWVYIARRLSEPAS